MSQAGLAGLFLVLSPTLVQADQERAPSAEEPKPASEQQSEPTDREWTFRWRDHPSLRFGDLVRIDFRARFQADVRHSEAAIGDDDGDRFDVARRRVGVAGAISNIAEFEVERELASDRPWRDVYVNFVRYDAVRLQAGKFKLPFSLDENTSPTNLDFVYRSRIASLLAPGRDRGAMVHGRVRPIRYEFGLFAHDGDNGHGPNTTRVFGDLTTAGRITVQPVRVKKSTLDDLELGVAFTSSDVPEGFSDLDGRTALGQSFFPPEIWTRGQRRRIGFEARWRPGPFSLKSEYIRLSNERQGQSVQDTDLPALIADGWYMSGTWILTGEQKSRGPDEPRRPLFQGGYGAIELAARLETLGFSSGGTEPPSTSPRADTILPRSDRAVTLGVNWFPNRWVKIQMNLIHDTIENADRISPALPPSFWSHVFRFQFSL